MHEKIRHLLVVMAIAGSMLTAGAATAGQKAEVKDLVGRDAVKPFDIMTSRGLASVDTYTTSSDDYLVTWWYNAKTGQCVSTQSKDSKVTSAAEDKHP
jgi:hypothetical protein